MKLNKLMFREYDIRGIWEEDINEEISYHIGRAFATMMIKQNKYEMIVGYDNRLSSPVIEKNLVKGLIDGGVNVTRLGLVTTPMYYYAWDKLDIHAGIMVTASHNPKEYNGFKMSYNGIHNIFGKEVMRLYDLIKDGVYSKGKGTIKYASIKEDYVKMINSYINMGKRKLKVVYDCGNGTTSVVANDVFLSTENIQYIPLFSDSDGTFPNHHPDPAVEDNLKLLKEKVLEVGADVGIAFDGDGDRVGIIDNLGNFLPIDKFMVIIWRDIYDKVEKKEGFFDVKCSSVVKDELIKLGIKPIETRTGNSYTKKISAENNYPFGGEMSGHLYFRDRFIGNDDGIYAGLRLVEILSKTDKNIAHLLEGINKYYSTDENKIMVEDSKKDEIVEKVEEYCKSKDYNYTSIDGIKVLYSDGFALIRKSNTTPCITTRYEAKTKERLDIIVEEFSSLLDKLKK